MNWRVVDRPYSLLDPLSLPTIRVEGLAGRTDGCDAPIDVCSGRLVPFRDDSLCPSGPVGLKDRIEAFGGTMTLDSPSGGGMTLVAQLPLPEHSAREAAPANA